MNAELFKAEMRKAIKQAISEQPSHVVGIARECLWGFVARKLSRCQNAPVGTNAAWVAKQVYDEVVAEKPFSKFVYA